MGASSRQLERDIERTRQDLGQTVDRIAERVSPRRWAPKLGAVVAGLVGSVVAWRVVRRARRSD